MVRPDGELLTEIASLAKVDCRQQTPTRLLASSMHIHAALQWQSQPRDDLGWPLGDAQKHPVKVIVTS
jgi:hypothetical protein